MKELFSPSFVSYKELFKKVGDEMKGQTYVILTIVFAIITSVFAVLNVSVVEVNYLFWKGESPLIFVILFSVLLGGMLTMVVGVGKYFKLKKENKSLHQRLAQIESTVIENETIGMTENTPLIEDAPEVDEAELVIEEEENRVD